MQMANKTLNPSCQSRVLNWKLARGNRVSIVVRREGWVQLNQKPFDRLPTAGRLVADNLPADLVSFYSQYEGVGLESSPDRLVRLCRLNEVERIAWSDLHNFGDEPFAGWESFAGLRIGNSSFFDDIIYVSSSPCCPAGSILAFGLDVSGPGGSGPFPFECSLVLAATFSDWLCRLEKQKWIEYGLVPAEIPRLWPWRRRDQLAYYRSLNPSCEWDALAAGFSSKPWWQFW